MGEPTHTDSPHDNVHFMEQLTIHQTQLYGYIHALVHNADDAHDVFQSTSLILWRKFDQFQPGSSFIRWACTVAQFEVRNFLRSKRASRVTFSDELVESLAASVQEEKPGLGEARMSALKRCMTSLSSSDRHLIESFYRGSQPAAEIGEQAGRSRQSVSNSLRRIRRALFLCIRRTMAVEGQL